MYCPDCGALIKDGAKFCPECGARQVPAGPSGTMKSTCPFCGEELEADSVFCGNCGRALAGQTPSAGNAPRGTGTAAPPPIPPMPQSASPRTTRPAGEPNPKKSNTLPIVIAVILGVALLAFVVVRYGDSIMMKLKPDQGMLQDFDDEMPSVVTPTPSAGEAGPQETTPEPVEESTPAPKTEAEPEPAEEPEPTPEAEPEPAEETEPEPTPEPVTESEPVVESTPLPYADSLGAPAATDFVWIADEQSGTLTGSFLGSDELVGKWKGEIIFDGAWELVYVTIGTDGQITIDPYQIIYGDEAVDETGNDPYLFNGAFDISRVYGSGQYGSIDLYTFLESNGTQYGVGTFSIQTGESAKVYLVRP